MRRLPIEAKLHMLVNELVQPGIPKQLLSPSYAPVTKDLLSPINVRSSELPSYQPLSATGYQARRNPLQMKRK